MDQFYSGASRLGLRCAVNNANLLPLAILEISYQSEALRHLCIDDSIADHELGCIAADGLRNRLNDIRAADCVYELPAGHPRPIRLAGQDCYRLEIAKDSWLWIVPNHVKPRIGADGGPDWVRVRRILVIAVGSENVFV